MHKIAKKLVLIVFMLTTLFDNLFYGAKDIFSVYAQEAVSVASESSSVVSESSSPASESSSLASESTNTTSEGNVTVVENTTSPDSTTELPLDAGDATIEGSAGEVENMSSDESIVSENTITIYQSGITAVEIIQETTGFVDTTGAIESDIDSLSFEDTTSNILSTDGLVVENIINNGKKLVLVTLYPDDNLNIASDSGTLTIYPNELRETSLTLDCERNRFYNTGAGVIFNDEISTLIRFDLSQFSGNAKILSGSITLSKVGGDGNTFQIVNFNDTLDNFSDGYYDESTGSLDREIKFGSRLLSDETFFSGNETKDFILNDNGLQLIQSWIDSTNNKGFLVIHSDALINIALCGDKDKQPKLNLTYTLPEAIKNDESAFSGFASELDTGSILTGSESAANTGVFDTGLNIETGKNMTGSVPSIIDSGIVLSGAQRDIPSELLPIEVVTNTGVVALANIDDNGLFTRAFEKNEEHNDVLELQRLLQKIGLYTGGLTSIYDETTIEAVYTFQLAKGILTQDADKKLQGFMGPTTRKFINEEVENLAKNGAAVDTQLYQVAPGLVNVDTGLVDLQTSGLIDTGLSLSGILLSGSLFSGDLLTGNVLTGIVLSGEIFTGESITGNIFTGDEIFIIPSLDDLLAEQGMTIDIFESSNYTTDVLENKFGFSTDRVVNKSFRRNQIKNFYGRFFEKKGFKRHNKSGGLLLKQSISLEQDPGAMVDNIVLESDALSSGNTIQVEIPEGTLFKNTHQENYRGVVSRPQQKDIVNQDSFQSLKVGSTEKILLTDENGNSIQAKIIVPIAEEYVGKDIDITYSHDDVTREYLTTVSGQILDGNPVAIFYTDHFTTFSLGNFNGTFVINNDALMTTGLQVTLNSSISGATHMKFGNTIAERDAASWTGYQTGFAWTLSGTDGVERVYALFSGNGTIRNVADSIVLDIATGSVKSGLQLHLDSSTGGVRFLDLGYRNLYFTGIGGAYKTVWSGENVMGFNGSTQYIESTSGFITGYPFTLSARVKPSTVAGTKTIVMFGNTMSNNIYRGIQLNAAAAQITIRNGAGALSASSPAVLVANRWYHVIGVFSSATGRVVYVDNANPASTATTNTAFATTNPRRRVGRHPGSSTTNYFSGYIDEVRIYNTALNTGERQNIYLKAPTFDTLITSDTSPVLYGTWTDKMYAVSLVISGNTYAGINSGNGTRYTAPLTPSLNSGVYNVILNYTNVYGKTGTVVYTGGLTINTSGFAITYSPSTWTNQNVTGTLTGLDKTRMITNNSGEEKYLFTGNGSFVYSLRDQLGNTGNITATVTWIDRISPTFAGVTSGIVYTGNVSITFADANLSGATLNGAPYTSGTAITGEGNYTFVVHDLAGNSTGATFTIQFVLEKKIENQLLSLGYQTGTANLVALDDTYFIGTGNINMGPFTGSLLLPTVLESTNTFGGNLSEVEIPAGAILKNLGGSAFTGILNVPVFQTPSTYSSYIGQTAISAIDVGSTNHIYFKDSGDNDLLLTYRMPVPGKNTGDLINIYSSEDGINFTYLTTVPTILISGSPYVVFEANHMSVLVTASNNGTNISADKAANSTSGSAYTLLNNIVVAEGANTDLGVSQTNVTLILTAPTNRRFRAGSGTVTFTAGRDVTAASISVINATATITYSTNGVPNRMDTLTISNLRIQAITGNILPSAGNILRTCANPGTATIVGITCNTTNFGSLSQTFGSHKNLVVTLSGQTFVASSGNSGTGVNQRVNTTFVIPVITATDQFNNIITSYTGAKTLSYTGPGGSPIYTTGVSFTAGQSTTTLNTTLTQEVTGVTITVSDGTRTGPASSPFNVLAQLPIPVLSYNTGVFYENPVTNDGSISGNIILTLSGDLFSTGVISSGYITVANIPAGLTGVFVRNSGSQITFSLSGLATNHANINDTGNISVSFTTGAFVGYNPGEVTNSTKTGIAIDFLDPYAGLGLSPIADTMLDADTNVLGAGDCSDGKCQEMNYGTTNYLCLSDFGSKVIMKFNLSAVTTGSIITSAKLRLNRYHITAGTTGTGFKLTRIINNSGWIEGTKDTAAASAGEPNYKQRKRQQENWNNGSPGLVAGVDYINTHLLTLGGFTGNNTSTYNQEFTLNSNGLSVLQDRLDNPSTNEGFSMGDSNNGWLCTRSKEYATVGDRPLLTVTYALDTQNPVISSLDPVNNETGISVNNNLYITFDENIWINTGKNIYIKNLSDGSVFETISVASGAVSVAGSTATINPVNTFVSNTGYYVEIQSGAFKDRAGNLFSGVVGSGIWKFFTINTDQIPLVTGAYYTGVAYTGAILGGTILTTGSSNIIERGIYWSIISGFNDGVGTKVYETGNRSTTGFFTGFVGGFPEGTMIYFKAFAKNSEGNGYSLKNQFFTKPAKPVFGTATKLSNESFQINWSTVTGATAYYLHVSKDSGFATYLSGYGPKVITGSIYAYVTGLANNTGYYYKLIAGNSAGYSMTSDVQLTTTTILPGPIVWLKLEETAGVVAYDSTENYHDGIIFGAPLLNQSGADGKSFYFDGVNDDVNVVDFVYGQDFSVYFWFKTTATGNNVHLFSHGTDSYASGSVNVVLDYASQSLKTYINGNQSILNVNMYTGLVDGNWHLYTVTINDNDQVPGKKKATVYIDSVAKITNATVNAGNYAPVHNIVWGRVCDTITGLFNGYLDDLRIYPQDLTSGEVVSLYYSTDVTPPSLYGISSGGYYSGVTIGFSDLNFSGASLSGVNGNTYYSGSFNSGSTITGDGIYYLYAYDTYGNSTAATFTIDTIAPNVIGVSTGQTYNTGVTISFSDLNLSGATLSGLNGNTYYSGNFASGTLLTGAGTYILTVKDKAGNTTQVTFSIVYEPLTIGGITGFTFTGNIYSLNTVQNVQQQANTHLRVNDPLGSNSGFYTTVAVSDFSGQNGSIGSGSIYFKGNTIELINGYTNSGVVLASGMATYQLINTPKVYIKRDVGSYPGITGKYGDKFWLRTDIPAFALPDNYHGLLTYTLYDN